MKEMYERAYEKVRSVESQTTSKEQRTSIRQSVAVLISAGYEILTCSVINGIVFIHVVGILPLGIEVPMEYVVYENGKVYLLINDEAYGEKD